MKIALATALALVLAGPAYAAGGDVYTIFHADAAANAAAAAPATESPAAAAPAPVVAAADAPSPAEPPAPVAVGDTPQSLFLADQAIRDANDPAVSTDAAAETTDAVPAPAAATAGGSVRTLVTAAAVRHGVEPALAHAVATVESRYRCSAVGRSGELGVMQVKPATARGVGVTGNLRDCATGIEAGMRYLKAALDRHGADCAGVSAYNMGIHRNASFCNGYGRKVMAAMTNIRVASLD